MCRTCWPWPREQMYCSVSFPPPSLLLVAASRASTLRVAASTACMTCQQHRHILSCATVVDWAALGLLGSMLAYAGPSLSRDYLADQGCQQPLKEGGHLILRDIVREVCVRVAPRRVKCTVDSV